MRVVSCEPLLLVDRHGVHILGGVSCGSYETMAIAFVDAGGRVTGR